ncbi:sarcosine oxidase subunit gamma [Paracoccus tegillarcae]|uniref:Sarcosine oxidase subunit gamma n=1 Tax=Paracoccus tegillarcae TaxID=1529068 RepID=A0A2K9F3M5_9RHOB|nr:sarcosine oxidase subunit gamma family protein [Paracoccus tegillarcae]AUH33721.1 sarcosine oxidase subunit gamma [Paracoccus tegillarcae]
MAEPLATITAAEGLGMITIRADLDRAGDAIAAAAGLAIPEATRITTDGSRSLGWMSPDELLLILPTGETAQAIADLEQALTGVHALIADVSEMRAVFDVTGAKPEQALAKLCPVEFASMPKDGLRRTRAAQTAVAFWRQNKGFRIIGFRSTGDYLRLILENAAIAGSDLDPR